jgi:hypothetical protein
VVFLAAAAHSAAAARQEDGRWLKPQA